MMSTGCTLFLPIDRQTALVGGHHRELIKTRCLDVAVSAVPAHHRARSTEGGARAATAFVPHGAPSVTEKWEVDVPKGKMTGFHRAVQCQDDDVAVASSILPPSKEVQDTAWTSVMDDPAMATHDDLLDGREMIVAQRYPVNASITETIRAGR